MAIQYTPALGLPYPQVGDAPLVASRDLRTLAQKMDSEGSQIRGESTAALTTAQAAEVKAAQALARALAIDEPVHVGPNPPTDGEAIWVDTDEEMPPTETAWIDITDKPSSFPPAAHTHQISDVDGLTDALASAGTTLDWDAAITALNHAVA